MKKFYLLASLLTITILSRAQIKKGDVLLGGNIGFSTLTQKSDDQVPPNTFFNKSTSVLVSPSFGKAVGDNLVLGFDLVYSYQNSSNAPNSLPSSSKNNTFGAGIFMRNYKYIGGGFSLFGESRVGFTYGDKKGDNGASQPYSTEDKQLSAYLGVSPGIAYAVSRRWQIETEFPNILYASYYHNKETDYSTGSPDTHSHTNSFFIGSSLSNTFTLNVGLRYLIAAK